MFGYNLLQHQSAASLLPVEKDHHSDVITLYERGFHPTAELDLHSIEIFCTCIPRFRSGLDRGTCQTRRLLRQIDQDTFGPRAAHSRRPTNPQPLSCFSDSFGLSPAFSLSRAYNRGCLLIDEDKTALSGSYHFGRRLDLRRLWSRPRRRALLQIKTTMSVRPENKTPSVICTSRSSLKGFSYGISWEPWCWPYVPAGLDINIVATVRRPCCLNKRNDAIINWRLIAVRCCPLSDGRSVNFRPVPQHF